MRSPAVMTGYHKAATRIPPLKNPFTADGYCSTGDVFRRDENGFHFFVGRSDDMFVSGGENIYPGEVEKLLETHPAVQQALKARGVISAAKLSAIAAIRP